MFRRKRTCFIGCLTLAGLMAAPGAMAAERTWLGVNTNGEDEDGSTGNTGMTNVNDELSWAPILDFAIPGPGDTADFRFNATSGDLFGEVIIDGAFNPDHIIQRVTNWNGPQYSTQGRLLLHKDLELESISLNYGYTSGGQGENVFVVGQSEEVDEETVITPYTLTLTGDNPISFAGNRGGWGSISLLAGSVLQFTGDNQTFDSYNFTSSVNGASGIVEFANANATITLGDPGLSSSSAIRLGQQAFHVHADQTWLNPTGTGSVRLQGQHDQQIIHSIDGSALNNLGEVPFIVVSPLTTQNNDTIYVPEGTYQSLFFTGDLTSARIDRTRLTGDVHLAGGTVVPGEPGDEEEPDTPATQSEFSIVFDHGRRSGNMIHLDGHTLSTDRGIFVHKRAGANSANDSVGIHAAGSTLTVGGDLVIDDATLFSGNTTESTQWVPDAEGEEWLVAPDQETAEEDGYVFNEDLQEWGEWGFTQTYQALSEARRVGIHGDVDTVINLHGNYTTNARSISHQGNGLFESTMNLVGAGSTFEVAANAADEIVANTYAIGNLNVGTSADAASIQLVNDFVNDGSIVTDEDGNETRLNDDEVLLTNNLSIAAGSTLDVNGQGVAVHGSLSIDATGTLDLNTGLTLNDEDIVTSFFGVGNQAAAWNAVASQVMDSSNPDAEFSAIFQNDNTYWQVGEATGPLLGDMNLDGVVDAVDVAPFVLALTNPGEYQNQHGIDPVLVGDINNDGSLDAVDVQPFVQLLVGGGGDAVAIPEPGSLALLGLGGLALLRRRAA